MKQGKLRPWFRMLGMTILGSAIFALGFDLFLLPNQINIGGVSGIGMLLLELTGWGSVGLYSILINVPLFILGGKRLGRQFFFGSLAGMLTSSLLMDVFTRITPPQTEILLSAIYGGIFSGVGLGLVFPLRAVDAHRMLGMHVHPGRVAVNALVLVIEAFVLLAETPLYGLWTGIITAVVILYNFSGVWAMARVLLPRLLGHRGKALVRVIDGWLAPKKA